MCTGKPSADVVLGIVGGRNTTFVELIATVEVLNPPSGFPGTPVVDVPNDAVAVDVSNPTCVDVDHGRISVVIVDIGGISHRSPTRYEIHWTSTLYVVVALPSRAMYTEGVMVIWASPTAGIKARVSECGSKSRDEDICAND